MHWGWRVLGRGYIRLEFRKLRAVTRELPAEVRSWCLSWWSTIQLSTSVGITKGKRRVRCEEVGGGLSYGRKLVTDVPDFWCSTDSGDSDDTAGRCGGEDGSPKSAAGGRPNVDVAGAEESESRLCVRTREWEARLGDVARLLLAGE